MFFQNSVMDLCSYICPEELLNSGWGAHSP